MDWILPLVIGLLIGVGVGCLVTWLVSRRIREAEALQGQDLLAAKDAEIEKLSAQVASTQGAITELHNQLRLEANRAGGLEARANRSEKLEADYAAQGEQVNKLSAEVARLEQELRDERERAEVVVRSLTDVRQGMLGEFREVAARLTTEASSQLLQTAETKLAGVIETAKADYATTSTTLKGLLDPVDRKLQELDTATRAIENKRESAYGTLTQQLTSLSQAEQRLIVETNNLTHALKSSSARGNWGEVQLRRVVELAGMVKYCDFATQVTVHSSEGMQRPDLIVTLPAERQVVVDAKVPLAHFMQALETPDPATRDHLLAQHANAVHDHIKQLSKKSYAEQFDSLEFVVLFLPSESSYSAALQFRPELIEAGATSNVLIATPTTLIALLRAVAHGWRQQQMAKDAQRIAELGRELFERLVNLQENVSSLGKGLNSAVEAYNKFIGSFEARALVSARRFKELGVASPKELGEIKPIDQSIRASTPVASSMPLLSPSLPPSHNKNIGA